MNCQMFQNLFERIYPLMYQYLMNSVLLLQVYYLHLVVPLKWRILFLK